MNIFFFFSKYKMGLLKIHFGFCVMILVLSVVRGDKACEKGEFEEFYKKIADILVKRDRAAGVLLTLRKFKEDRKNVYECGEFLLSKIREYDAKNGTALTEEEKSLLRDEYSLLVSWIAGCGTVELWAGEKKGGTIASAIYHFVGVLIQHGIFRHYNTLTITMMGFPVLSVLGVNIECEKWAFVHFFEGICKTLRMRGAILLDTVHALARDEISIYRCGQITYSEIRRVQNLTTIRKEDEIWIQELYEYLVSCILNCDSCELWKGKFGGGGICTKIFLAVGGNMTDMINPEWIDHSIHYPRWTVVY